GPSPLAPAMASMLAVRRPKPAPNERQAIGWVVSGGAGDEILFHDGGSFGFVSALACDPRRHVGVVVLSNQLTGVADLARHLLRPAVPLERPQATKRTEIQLDAAALDACAGSYDAEDEGTFVVAHERGALTVHLPASWGLPPMRVHPESRHDFFS